MRRCARSGAASIEFAMLSPLFVLIMAAFVDVGWVYFHQSQLDAAVASGCRAASLVDPGPEEDNFEAVQIAAEEATRAELALGDCDVTVYPFGTAPTRSLVCEARQPIQPITTLTLWPVTLSSSISVRMEWQRGEQP